MARFIRPNDHSTTDMFFFLVIESLLLIAEKVIPVGSLDDFSKLANEIRGKSKKSRTRWERRQVMTVASVYELLLLAPKEYLSKTQRSSFVQRGLVADMAMYLSAKLDDNKQVYLQPRMMVRTWLGIASDTVDILALAVRISPFSFS